LPADAAITPFFFKSEGILFIFVIAPLTLKDPVFWRHSSFRKTLLAHKLEKVVDFIMSIFLILD
jgi:hypothetical protein